MRTATTKTVMTALLALGIGASAATAQQGDALDRVYRGVMEQAMPGQPLLLNCFITYFDPLAQDDRDAIAAWLTAPDFDAAAPPPQPILDILSELPPQDAYFNACRDAVARVEPLPDASAAAATTPPQGDALDPLYRGMLEGWFPGETAMIDCMMSALDPLGQDDRDTLAAFLGAPDSDPAAPPPAVLDIFELLPDRDAYLRACRAAVAGVGPMPDAHAAAAAAAASARTWPPRSAGGQAPVIDITALDREGTLEDFLMRALAIELGALLRANSIDVDFRVRNGRGPGDAVSIVNYILARPDTPPDGTRLGQLMPLAHLAYDGHGRGFTASDFTAIVQFGYEPTSVQVLMDHTLTDLAHLVHALQTDPGAFAIACGGPCYGRWAVPFLSMLLDEGVDLSGLRLVPDDYLGQGVERLASGEVDIYLGPIRTATASDTIRSIGLMHETRLPSSPDARTVLETPFEKAYFGGVWYGLAGPAGMAPEIVADIERAVRMVAEHPNYRAQMERAGIVVEFLGHEDFTARFQRHFDDAARVHAAVNGE